MKLYHRTSINSVQSILEHGLRPNDIGIVYLSPTQDTGFGDVLFEVETGDNRLTAFEDCEDWEVLCWESIPAEKVKLINGV